MHILVLTFISFALLSPATASVYTGFNCGGNVANSVSAKGSDVYTAMVSPSDPPPATISPIHADSSYTEIYTAMVSPSDPPPVTLSTVLTPAFNDSTSEYEAPKVSPAPTVSPAYLARGAPVPLSLPLQATQVVSTRTSTVTVTRTTTIILPHSPSLPTNIQAGVAPPPAPLETTQAVLTPLTPEDIALVAPPLQSLRRRHHQLRPPPPQLRHRHRQRRSIHPHHLPPYPPRRHMHRQSRSIQPP
jgi:hypothetical protein